MRNVKSRSVFIVTALLVLSTSVAAKRVPKQAAIASAHPLATAAGHEILAAGGNAFDAAVTVAAVLAVVEPFGSGIGGGAFFLLHQAKDDTDIMLDARETAPMKAKADMYLDKNGEPNNALSREGPLAAGIPGLPAALEKLAKEYGRKSLAELLAPAIHHAESGFATGDRYQKMTAWRASLLNKYPASAGIFLLDGKALEKGFQLKQKDLAKTLMLMADKGAAGFYTGEFAKTLVEGVNAAGGIWQVKDLQNYRVVKRKPVYGEYKGMRVVSAALPSSGGIVLVNALNILARFDLNKLSETDRTHLVIEAMRRAYRDRAEFLGDADFVDVPVDRLIHPYYAAGQAASIRLDKATPSTMLAGMAVTPAGDNTTHFSVMDKEGNYVAATLSINFPFGSGFMVPGTGVILNNEMDDFAAKAGVPNGYGLIAGKENPNSIAPGKRMLSSMTPTFLETKNRLAVIGTPGGSRIISMVLLATLEFWDGGSANKLVSLPRFHHQFSPDQILFESDAFNNDTQLELQLRGHRLKESSRKYGNMHVVVWNKKKNRVKAASDPRGEGRATVK